MILWICLALFLMYFVGYEIWWGLTRYKKIIFAIGQGDMPKTRLYIRLMLGLWIPAGLVFLLLTNGQFTLNDLGLSWFKLSGSSGLFYILAATAGLYFMYLTYSLIVLRIYAMKKLSINQNMSEEVKALIPATKKEKQVWVFTAITAGITEELLYRGFFFYLMGELFAGLNIFIILGISALIFGIGHIYQGFNEALKPTFMGLLFGLFYISFGTIIPCIVLHVMQDLCVVDMINEQ
ncbi:MAG: CPBP family intramembrane glutamic endopeptidase [Syntrophomonas sp.]